MAHNNVDNDRLAQARKLVVCLEAGDDAGAQCLIQGLSGNGGQLFQEIGRLTRELHEAIHGFLLDDRLLQLAEHEMPDATERLNYVITMTEQSAHATLSAVEISLPLAEELEQSAASLEQEWKRFCERKLPLAEFRELSDEIGAFLTTTNAHSQTLHGKLSEVLMAQGFQDLTGQIIRRVIEMVKDVEEKLVHLIKISGHKAAPVMKRETELEGPVVPGLQQGDVIASQDDVDDLLSSLGF